VLKLTFKHFFAPVILTLLFLRKQKNYTKLVTGEFNEVKPAKLSLSIMSFEISH